MNLKKFVTASTLISMKDYYLTIASIAMCAVLLSIFQIMYPEKYVVRWHINL